VLYERVAEVLVSYLPISYNVFFPRGIKDVASSGTFFLSEKLFSSSTRLLLIQITHHLLFREVRTYEP